jgi:ABC-2 type transport system ATP-binding protein
MSLAVETDRLTKRYGRHTGVVALDLSVERGEVFGFLGPNGAGKTTTIRTLLDLIRPTEGKARVLGLDSHAAGLEIRRRTGYLPGELAMYERLTGAETLRFFANLRGGVDQAFVAALAERLEVDLSRRVGDLSTGNKRKLGLLQAFMHKPELIILDEPTVGLDPLVQHEFYRMVEQAKAAGQTVFLSSHVLPEVQRVCDRVAFIREGRLVAVEEVAELTGRAVRELEVSFATPVAPEAFTGVAGVSDVTGVSDVAAGNGGLRMTVTGSLDAVVKRLAAFEVVTMTCREPDLDDVFLAFYGAPAADPAAAKPAAATREAGHVA